MPKVSVVMCVYNHEKFVGDAIESVFNQTYQDWEFIITNDASTDRSLDIIKQYEDPRIKLFSLEKNTGARIARNNSIKHAQGDYIAVINSDDIWLPNKLEKQVNFLDVNHDIGAVFTYASFINDATEDIGYEHYYGKIFIQYNRSRFDWLRDFFLVGNCLCHPSVLIRKICHEVLGLYDERLGQLADFDMWIRVVAKYQIHILAENLVKFRLLENQGNISANKPENNSRVILEWSQVLKNYLQPEILENLNQIFNFKININEVGLSIKPQPISRDIAPFFLAMLATKTQKPGHQYFGFDVLYQMLANQELAQKLKDQYSFDFSNLVNLALEQDIFGIVRVGELEAKLQRKNSEIAQIKEDKQDYLDSLRNQLRQLELLLEEYQTQLHQTEDISTEYKSKISEIESLLELYQSQLHQTEEVLEKCHTQLKQELKKVDKAEKNEKLLHHFVEDLRNQLYQVEELLRGYKTELEGVEVIALSYQDKYRESQIQVQQAQNDAKEYQDRYQKSEDALHKSQTKIEELKDQFHTRIQQVENDAKEYQDRYQKSEDVLHKSQIEIKQLKEQFHASRTESERLIQEVQQQLKQTESIKTDYQGYYQDTELELQKVRSHLHQKQTELKRYQSEHYQLIEKLSILDQQTKQNGEKLIEKQEIIMQLDAARNDIQQKSEQYELLLQESQSHIDELQQVIGDLLSSKQDDANIYKQELNKIHQNQVEAEIALANSQSELKAIQVEIEKLKSWQAFNDSQVSEGGVSKYKTLIWQAWQAYSTANYGQMTNYLQQSLDHASLSRPQAMIDWIENFGRFASAQGTHLDTYFLTNLPEWQQLVRQVVKSSPPKLSIINRMIPK